MGETECVFKRFCTIVWDSECDEKDPSWETCDNYWFAVLVHNHGIEEAIEIWPGILDELKALRKPEGGG